MFQIKNSKIQIISTSGVFKDKASLFLLFEFIIGIFIVIFSSFWLIDYLIKGIWLFWFLVPFSIYGSLFLFTFSISLIAFLLLRIVNSIYPPQEGIFERDSKDWKFWKYRYWIMFLPLWSVRALPLPWMDVVVYRMFGVKIGRNVGIYDGWVDPEFVSIGDHTMTSLNTMIHSHLIYNNKLFIKRVIIGKNCIVGPQTVISPGTIMKKEAILGANSVTLIDQVLESGLIYIGIPALKSFPITSLEEAEEKLVKLGKYKKNENNKENLS